MPKHGFLTPKAISNRIKAKGLQKLRWYCQMCQKQCRDQNGFKCHLTSEGHARQMKIVASDVSGVIDSFSQAFETEYIELLSRRFGERRVRANLVYNEMVGDRHHVHMNSTMWTTLTSFVKYLGRTGKAVVDETEKGWFVQWINRDPARLAQLEKEKQMEQARLNDDARSRKFVERQAAAARAAAVAGGADTSAAKPTALRRKGEGDTVSASLGGLAEKAKKRKPKKGGVGFTFGGGTTTASSSSSSSSSSLAKGKGKRPLSAMEELMRDSQEAAASKRARTDDSGGAAARGRRTQSYKRVRRGENWVMPGIVVKVINKSVGGGKFYKRKAAVTKVADKFTATVKLVDSSSKLRLDQDDLETVIPALGALVRFVNGPLRGTDGELESIDVDNFCARIVVTDESTGEMVVQEDVPYEDVCKIASRARR